MLFQQTFIHAGPYTWWNRINQRSWAFRVPWSPSFVLNLPPRGGFWKQSEWPWNMIHSMPRRNPCRLYIHRAFTYPLCWSLECSVKQWIWTGSAFSTNESAWSVMVMGSQSHVWSGPLCLFWWVRGHVTCIYKWTLRICRFVFFLNEIDGRCAQIVLNLVMWGSSWFNHWHRLGGLYNRLERQKDLRCHSD
jgi:hypothetical protein